MVESVEKQVFKKISKARRGIPFFAENFATYGSPAAVRKALDRLVKAGKLERVATGLYIRPRVSPVIGKVTPPIDELAKAIARRDRARIAPTGIYALNKLGLSTQVPMNVVYLTDGAGRKVRIGRRTITFKKTTPKNVATLGQTSHLVIQALKVIGKNNITRDTINRVQDLLKHEHRDLLAHDIKLAPAWIREIMQPSLNQ